MAVGTRIGFAPTISAAILKQGAHGWLPVTVFVSVIAVAAAISVDTARESYRTPMHERGKHGDCQWADGNPKVNQGLVGSVLDGQMNAEIAKARK
ncbi:hypothetical protein ACFQAT_12575 [Undibacterium arcticum]